MPSTCRRTAPARGCNFRDPASVCGYPVRHPLYLAPELPPTGIHEAVSGDQRPRRLLGPAEARLRAAVRAPLAPGPASSPQREAHTGRPGRAQAHRPPVHRQGIQEEQPPGEGLAAAGQQLERLGRLDRADNAGDRRKDAHHRAAHLLDVLRLRKQAVVARGSRRGAGRTPTPDRRSAPRPRHQRALRATTTAG